MDMKIEAKKDILVSGKENIKTRAIPQVRDIS